jgi:uncharacterized protein (DUF2147 family)
MKKLMLMVLGLGVCGLCFAADPVEGYWLSVDEKSGKVTGGWHIYEEGGKLLGSLISSTEVSKGVPAGRCKESYPGFPIPGNVKEMPVVGDTPWIYGLTMEKPGVWGGGHIINPEDGKIYKCKIFFRAADGKKFQSDTLEMRGEIGLGIGRSQFWRKTDKETAGSLEAR